MTTQLFLPEHEQYDHPTHRRVIVAGGRNFKPSPSDPARLTMLLRNIGATQVISGGARGADAFGEAIARTMNLEVRHFPAQWDRYGRAAGPIRNEKMAKIADALIVYPGGKGTESMIRIARNHHLPIYRRREES
jgi:hypothetical protein